MSERDYSHRTLVEKLGIGQGENMTVINAPDNYDQLIDDWPIGVSVSRDVLNEVFSFIHYFAVDRAKLATEASRLVEHLAPGGKLWLSWPKASSSLSTDINEQDLRDIFLPLGVVDNKVAAIDETWSGLRFVHRKLNK